MHPRHTSMQRSVSLHVFGLCKRAVTTSTAYPGNDYLDKGARALGLMPYRAMVGAFHPS